MSCPLCVSDHVAEFPVEMIIHFTGLKNIDRQGVLLFPQTSNEVRQYYFYVVTIQ